MKNFFPPSRIRISLFFYPTLPITRYRSSLSLFLLPTDHIVSTVRKVGRLVGVRRAVVRDVGRSATVRRRGRRGIVRRNNRA